LSLFIAFCSRAQLREQKVGEIAVQAQKQNEKRIELNSSKIDRNIIQELQPEDLGFLLQKFPGVALKSYGGLGGLKTFSVRSLGSQHTATVLDGFLLQNTQVGQINLGQIPTNSIESLRLGTSNYQVLSPISALFRGNELAISTFEGSTAFNAVKVRLSSKFGSFGQFDEYLALQYSQERIGITLHGKYRKSEGNYPFRLKVLNYTYDGVQKNNQLEELYSGVTLFFRPNTMKQPIRLIYRNTFIDQGLPGATVLYNSYNKQYLNTVQHSLSADWTDKYGLAKVRYYGSYQYDNQIYTDSFYFNQANLLRKVYTQNNGNLGLSLSKNKFGELINFYGGIEERYAQLNLGNQNLIVPERWQTYANAGLKINEKKFLLDLRLGYQFVLERDSVDLSFNQRHLFAPVLNLESKEIGRLNWKMSVFSASTSRLPSFNELYYSQVGNKQLKPEEAKQVVLSNGISKSFKKWFFTSKIQIYYNHITNKILAIPTKNLFVWSIQNIGTVHASGVDFVQSVQIQPNENWNTTLTANYSFQRSIDRSSDLSPSYGHQIAYTPQHTANIDLSIYRKKTGIRFSSIYVGERFSLNENIPMNLLAPFYTFDLSIFQRFTIKSKHQFNLQFQVKNCADVSYTYVRSFVMPGRNYLLSFNYEL